MKKLIYLDDAIDVTWQDPSYNDPINVLTEVRDRLRALPTVEPEVIACGEGELNVHPEQRWIPVTERLPDEDYYLRLGRHFSADVLMTVCNSNNDEWICELGHTINGEWYSEVYDEYYDEYIEEPRKVIAWVPLPEPYQPKEDEQCTLK